MIHPIRVYGDPVLRRVASPVTIFDDSIGQLAEDMIETMIDASGVGLAAPQIGVPLRIFVAQRLVDDPATDDATVDATADAGGDPSGDAPSDDDEEAEEHDRVAETVVMVNPTIVDAGGERVAPDGCLSLPGLWIEDMRRHSRVTVRYQDVAGVHHERTAHDHFAHVIQHEYDHLEGILFFDHLPVVQRQAFLDEHRRELAQMQRDAKALLRDLGHTRR